jgi:hypothetical protein
MGKKRKLEPVQAPKHARVPQHYWENPQSYYAEHPESLHGYFRAIHPDGTPVLSQFPDDARDDPPTYLFVCETQAALATVMTMCSVREYKEVEITDGKMVVDLCTQCKAKVYPDAHWGGVDNIKFNADGTRTTQSLGLPRDNFLTVNQLIPFIHWAQELRRVEERAEQENDVVVKDSSRKDEG